MQYAKNNQVILSLDLSKLKTIKEIDYGTPRAKLS